VVDCKFVRVISHHRKSTCFSLGTDQMSRVSRPAGLHHRPLAEPDVVGIEPRRAHLVINDEVTFSRAPLQARKVGFPDSGFDLGISPRGLPEMEQA